MTEPPASATPAEPPRNDATTNGETVPLPPSEAAPATDASEPDPTRILPTPADSAAPQHSATPAHDATPAAAPAAPPAAPPGATGTATPPGTVPPAPSGGPPPGWTPGPGWTWTGTAAPVTPAGAPRTAASGRRTWRSWPGWRRFLVPGLIGLIIGGLLGSGITALATSGHDQQRRVPFSRFGPGHGFGPGFGPGFGHNGFNRGGPGNGPGFGNRGGAPAPTPPTAPTPQPTQSG
ncbi:MAG TPA: hypothetical protein VFR11_15665 [Micromonosporaceae bacterium]|nr:hypothetical protein [Micromonosporaceae bacterium]